MQGLKTLFRGIQNIKGCNKSSKSLVSNSGATVEFQDAHMTQCFTIPNTVLSLNVELLQFDSGCLRDGKTNHEDNSL